MSDAHNPIPRERRFVDGRRCPICGGADNDARGFAMRCHGFYSGDGTYAHCAREEKAGGIERNTIGLFAHRINAPCKCGREHDGTPPEITDEDIAAATPLKTEKHAVYDYVDEQGRPLFRVSRFKMTYGDGRVSKTFSQSRWENEKWIAGVRGVRQVLYRLPDVLKAPADEPIYVVEGEKCVEVLCDKSYTATCNAGGAGKWRAEHVAPLKGKHVVILPDNDEAGRKHALQVATSLHEFAASLKVIDLPGLPPHGDIADAIEARGDAALNEMEDLVDDAPLWTPSAAGTSTSPGTAAAKELSPLPAEVPAPKTGATKAKIPIYVTTDKTGQWIAFRFPRNDACSAMLRARFPAKYKLVWNSELQCYQAPRACWEIVEMTLKEHFPDHPIDLGPAAKTAQLEMMVDEVQQGGMEAYMVLGVRTDAPTCVIHAAYHAIERMWLTPSHMRVGDEGISSLPATRRAYEAICAQRETAPVPAAPPPPVDPDVAHIIGVASPLRCDVYYAEENVMPEKRIEDAPTTLPALIDMGFGRTT